MTQVVGPVEGYVFHNRLTHTLEVSQIARRLAEHFREKIPACKADIDPDVVECAAMAHDLGHPPFGHAAEDELKHLAKKEYGLVDGFEGNAQSFRIVTRLAELNPQNPKGLDLTRASLNAVLKYPWIASDPTTEKKRGKFGAYDSDRELFIWARALGPAGIAQCAEAQIMDLADDIAYSVHDVDDFYRAGLLPLDQLAAADRNALLDFLHEWELDDGPKLGVSEVLQLKNLLDLVRFGLPYQGTRAQRAGLRAFTSTQIGRFVGAVGLESDSVMGWRVTTPEIARLEIKFLKRLVWIFVITNRRLATLQAGQRRVVRDLVTFYCDLIEHQKLDALPPLFREDAEGISSRAEAARLAIDMVSSLADEQAHRLGRRVLGLEVGSIYDHVDS